MRIRTRSLIALGLAGSLLLAACGSDDGGGEGASGTESEPVTLNIVGFAVPEAANVAIAEEFNKTDEGANVSFKSSYGASGDQSRAVAEGLAADYVHFSVASDVTRLVDEGLVADTWDDGPPRASCPARSWSFAVREGNPKDIEDLGRPGQAGRGDRHPEPRLVRSRSLERAGRLRPGHRGWRRPRRRRRQYVTDLFANVVSLPSSGRDATTAFLGGTGDVLLAYENEAILAHQNGEEFDYIIPETTMLIENPGAVLIDADPKAQDWLDFVLSTEGQKQFALKGFRPVIDGVEYGEVEGANDPADPFPEVTNLLTVEDDFESWSALSDKFFDEEEGIITVIIAESGKGE